MRSGGTRVRARAGAFGGSSQQTAAGSARGLGSRASSLSACVAAKAKRSPGPARRRCTRRAIAGTSRTSQATSAARSIRVPFPAAEPDRKRLTKRLRFHRRSECRALVPYRFGAPRPERVPARLSRDRAPFGDPTLAPSRDRPRPIGRKLLGDRSPSGVYGTVSRPLRPGRLRPGRLEATRHRPATTPTERVLPSRPQAGSRPVRSPSRTAPRPSEPVTLEAAHPPSADPGGRPGIRTQNLRIKSPLLYR